MEKISRDDIKKRGVKRFLNSFKYSFEGIMYAYKNEQSMLIHLAGSIITIILSIIFHIKPFEWAIIGTSLGFVLALELVNTAIEACVDLVTLNIHPLAKIAKDCGSAATFVATVMTIVAIAIIFVPYIF